MTRKQQIFVKEYVLTRNGAKSAIKAGFTAKSARSTACKLLQTPTIQAEVDRQFAEIVAQYDLSEDQIKVEYGKFIHGEGIKDENKLRALDSMARIKGMFKDTTSVNIALFSNIDTQKVDKLRKALSQRGLGRSSTPQISK